MTQYIIYIFGAFLVSALCGFIIMPIIMKFCKKKGLYDIPDGRKIHHNAIPRLGGISFLPSMLQPEERNSLRGIRLYSVSGRCASSAAC